MAGVLASRAKSASLTSFSLRGIRSSRKRPVTPLRAP